MVNEKDEFRRPARASRRTRLGVVAAAATIAGSLVGVGSSASVAALPDAYEPVLVDDVETNFAGLTSSSIAVSATHVYTARYGGIGPEDPTPLIVRHNRATGASQSVVASGGELTGAELWFVANDRLFFAGTTAAAGTEPWVLDLGTGNAAMIADVNPGSASSYPDNEAVIDGAVYFAADDGTSGKELWRTAGTPGSINTIDVNPGPGGSNPTGFVGVPVAGTSDVAVYFAADDGVAGTELHRLDGSSLTTYDLRAGASSSPDDLALAADGALYGRARDAANKVGVLRIATPSSTPATDVVELMPIPHANIDDVAVVGSVAFAATAAYPTGDGDLYVHADKNAAGVLVEADTGDTQLMAAGGGVLLSSYHADTDRYSLSVSGGTAVETVASDLNSVTLWTQDTSTGAAVAVVGTDTEGREPWVSGGTVASTGLLADIFPGVGDSDVNGIAPSPGGGVAFLANDGATGQQVWQSDLTPGGTARLTSDVTLPSLGSNPGDFLRVGGSVFFTAITQATGEELWVERTPGGGAELVVDLLPGPGWSRPHLVTAFGSRLLFTADDENFDEYTYVTDGTAAGTTQVADEVHEWVVVGDGLVVRTSAGQLLRWNETTGAMEALGAITDTYDAVVGPLGNAVFVGGCVAECGIHAVDATTGATTLVVPGDDVSLRSGVVAGAHAVLHVSTSTGYEAWRTDGTAAGTAEIAALDGSSVVDLWAVGDAVITASGSPVDVMRGPGEDYSFTSIAADGTVTSIADPPGEGISRVEYPNVSGTVDFDGGAIAIVSRGGSDPTNLVTALSPQTSALLLVRPTGVTILAEFADFDVVWADVVEDEIVFVLEDSRGQMGSALLDEAPVAPPELWASDGAATGTRRVFEFADAGLSNVRELRLLGDDLYFSAQDPTVGAEPFRLPLITPVTEPEPEPEPVPSFVPLDPGRILDTRDSGETVDDRFEKTGRMSGDDVIELDVAGRADVPPDATSVVLNVTMVRPDANGFLAVYPCGDRPLASSMNAPSGGSVVANEMIAKVSADGTVCIHASVATHVVADVTGYTPAGTDYVALEPARMLDTRDDNATGDGRFAALGRVSAGGSIELDVLGRNGVPASGVGAVVLNVTMIRPGGNGYVTIHPCGDRPEASSMNAPSGGRVVANEVIAKVSATGTVCLYSSVDTHLAADVVGYVPDTAGLSPLEPGRLLDTRDDRETVDDRFAGIGRLAAGDQVELEVVGRGGVPASGVSAVVLNVTMIRPDGNGFVTIFPCGDRPLASSMNAPAGGGVVANEVIAKVSATGTVCLYSSVGTHLAADVAGFVAE